MDAGVILAPRESTSRTIFWAAAAYAALIYATLPSETIAINDDFGYLKSVVQTIQHGRPWTNDWLAPWAGSFSGLCALVFKLTGKFHLATAGVQAMLAGISFWTLGKLLVARDCMELRASGLAALVMTAPTLLWKSLEFTGMTLHLSCLLLALFTAERGRWGWFAFVWLIAIGNRQSAITWATFPAWAVLSLWLTPRGFRNFSWWKPAAAALGGAAGWLIVGRVMNKTLSQMMTTDHVFDHVTWGANAPGLVKGAAVFFLAVGLGAMALRVGSARRIAFTIHSRVVTAALVALGLVVMGVNAGAHIAREHACFDGVDGWLYLKLFVGIALVGWMGGGLTFRGAAVVGAAGNLLLTALRSEVWDYYLTDVAIFGLFAVAFPATSMSSATSAEGSGASAFWRWTIRSGVTLLAAFHLLFLFQLKFRLDRGLAFDSVAERALRLNELGPADLSFLPFGFIGWHVHPYYTAHEGKTNGDLDGFHIYHRREVAAIRSRYGGPLRLLPIFRDEPVIDPATLLVHERRRIGWFFPADYWLVRLPTEKITPAQVPIDLAEYRMVPFPLNDAEWSALIKGPRL